MHKAPDPRVDVALYFVNPHRIKDMDVSFMAHLSEAVPVIPILAKVRRQAHTHCHVGSFVPSAWRISARPPPSSPSWQIRTASYNQLSVFGSFSYRVHGEPQ